MKVIVDIGHPAHVHFFKNFILEMRKRNHEIMVTASEKEVTLGLLDAYGIDYTYTCKRSHGIGLLFELIKRDIQMYLIARWFKPDIITGIHNMIVAHVSKWTKAKSVIFTDTEHAKIASMVTFPFSDTICTPSCFKKDLGKKQIRYNGYHELAYLHPKYFTPDPSVLAELGLRENDKFAIVRFVSWGASHDRGQHGFSFEGKRKLVSELAKHARVLITSESPLPEEFEPYRITVGPEKIHDLLAYASLYIGEGATMASECAVLGTPAIYVNTLRLGYLDEQESEYGLVYNFLHPYLQEQQILNKATDLIEMPDVKSVWKEKRKQLLEEKIDVTKYMISIIERYI